MPKVALDRTTATAGLELAAMGLPQSLGYAAIAGMPSITGLYTLLAPLAGFAAFGSSRYLVVAADSATAAILAGGLSPLATAGSARYVALAGLTALMTAVLLLAARLLKLGFIADFLSQTVLAGFLTGVGFQVAIGVMPAMAGIKVASRRTPLQLIEMAQNLSSFDWQTLALSVSAVAVVLGFARFAHRFPGPLVAVAGSIAASFSWDFAHHGIAIIGSVAGGLPHPTLPPLNWHDIDALVPVAAACFVMIVTQSAATARVYALKHRQDLDENKDILGLAVANGLAAFTGAFVVNGSPTQTSVLESAGAKSRLAHVVTAGVVALVLLFFTAPLQYLPRCVLGAIVFTVALRLIDLRGLRAIRRESPGEFVLAAVTAAVVILVGVEQGILLAMVMSLLRIVSHSYHPHTAVLLKGEGGTWELTPVKPGAVTEPGLVVYRFGAPLFYANAGRFCDEVRTLAVSPVRWILVDAGAITKIDFSASRALELLRTDLIPHGTALVFAHVTAGLRADFDRHHLTQSIGPEHVFDKMHDAVDSFHRQAS